MAVSPEHLDLKKLKTFQLVARYGGLSGAARRLRLTTPAVSFQIRSLETELGIELFQRIPQGLLLTRAGENLLRATSGIFEGIDKALSAVTAKDSLGGQLSISTSGDIIGYFTARISTFMKRYPDVKLKHHAYNSVYTQRLVNSGAVDVGIGNFPTLPASLQKEPIVTSTLALICAEESPASRRAPVRLEDLSRSRIVLPPAQSSTRKLIDRTFRRSGLRCADVIETGSCHTARDFVANGIGPAIVHSLCVGYASPPSLRYIDVGAQFGKVEFSVLYRRENTSSPIARAFIDFMREREG